MENYELHLEPDRPQRNLVTGRFLKGNVPHNKGRKMKEWMDGRKVRRVIRIAKGNLHGRHDIGGWNKKQVVGVSDDGRHTVYASSAEASRALGLSRPNIGQCCRGTRKHCGGMRWYFYEDNAWIRITNR